MLDRIGTREPDDLAIALKALTWLVCCTRPLKLNELGVALAIDPNDETFNEGEKLDSDDQLLEICGSLIKLDQDFVVELGHFSVKEFLTSKRLPGGSINPYYIDGLVGHELALGSCLSYLSFTLYKDGVDGEPIAREQELLHYAVYQWYKHGRHVDSKAGDVSRIISFLKSPPSVCFFTWSELWVKPEHGTPHVWKRPIQAQSQFKDGDHFALKLGLNSTLQILRAHQPQLISFTLPLEQDWQEHIRGQLRCYGWDGWSPCPEADVCAHMISQRQGQIRLKSGPYRGSW
jgi:hypothetical protein